MFVYYRLPFRASAANDEQAAAKAAAANADSGAPTMYRGLTLFHYCHFEVTECL